MQRAGNDTAAFALRAHHYGSGAADAENMAADVSDHITRLLADAIAARGTAILAVSGGRSPIPLLHSLSKAKLAWRHVQVTLVDERWVAVDAEDSNERLVREHLLTGAAAEAGFLGLKTDAATPQAALAERQAALRELTLPFDAVVLGMGEDGHTASLFPGAAGLAAALDPAGSPLLAAIDPPAAAHRRLGLSLRGILNSRQIILCIAGAAKRRVFERAREGADALALPVAAVLRQTSVPVDVYLAG